MYKRIVVILSLCGVFLFLFTTKHFLLKKKFKIRDIQRKDLLFNRTKGHMIGHMIIKEAWNLNVTRWLKEEAKSMNLSASENEESELAVQEPTVLPNVSWYKTHSNRCPKGNMTWEELPENVRNMVSQRIVVNDHYKLMYCPTPMVSVGPFMRLMYAIEWNIPVAQVSSKHIGKRENFAYLSDYSIQEQTDMIDTYRKFIVTRHPFMRLLAVYKQKFMASNAYFHERYGKEIVRKFRGDTGKVSKGNDVTFEEFVKYIGYYFPQNEHWMMQYSLCLPCHVQYDISLHYETVKEESLKLLNHFHLESVVDAVPIDAWDYIDSQEAQAMFDTIPVQIMGKLVQNYEKDFELFDYSSLSFTSV